MENIQSNRRTFLTPAEQSELLNPSLIDVHDRPLVKRNMVTSFRMADQLRTMGQEVSKAMAHTVVSPRQIIEEARSGALNELLQSPPICFQVSSTPQRVSAAQIHAELYEAATVSRPKPIGAHPEPDEQVQTLLAMGFSNQEAVLAYRRQEATHLEAVSTHTRQQALWQQQRHYALRYPNYKFIPHEALQHVATKYGLLVRGTSHFTGPIPPANIREMQRFLATVVVQPDDYNESLYFERFLIAAPRDQFVAEPQRSWPSEWLLDDPLVLQPVQGGYLVITAWGDEAADPDVLNERNN